MIQLPIGEEKQVQYIMLVGDAYTGNTILAYLEHELETVLIVGSHHSIEDFSKENGDSILVYRSKHIDEHILTLGEYPQEEIIIEEHTQAKSRFIDRTTKFNHKYTPQSKSLGRPKKSFHSRKK